ncbi:MAG: transcription elongation factor Spt5 [Candidatus Korarchaeota archaeon]
MPIFLVRCAGGRERDVAEIVSEKAKSMDYPVYAVLSVGDVKGYILVEAASRAAVARAVYNVRYIKSGPVALVKIEDIAAKIKREVVIENIEPGDIVELSDPKGVRARVVRIDGKGNAVVEILNSPGMTMELNVSTLKLIDKHQETSLV